MILSICIPTYNRPVHLENCLNSICIAKKKAKKFKFEVCISDNGSKHDIKKIVFKYKQKIKIKFHRFKRNYGITTNFLKTIEMAKGEFVWTIGNDDLLIPKSLLIIQKLLKKFKKADYFFINSSNLGYDYLEKFETPFDTKNLPKKMVKFSNYPSESKFLKFWELINPKTSEDFLLGMFFSLFRKKNWDNNLQVLNKKNFKDRRWMSTFDNTCFNVKIFAQAFKNSYAYYCSKPLSVNLSGVREWHKLYPFIVIVRFPEILDEYKKAGMSRWRYYYCKNYVFKDFINYFSLIILKGKDYGRNYINYKKHIFKNLLYPNVYLSIIYYFLRKSKNLIIK